MVMTHRVVSRGLGVAIALLVAVAALGVGTAIAHPLHTTLTRLTIDPATRAPHVSIRVFADDFGTVVARRARIALPADHRVPEAAMAAYVAATFTIADRTGRPLALAFAGSRREGDVVWIDLKVPAGTLLSGVRLQSAMLFELYDDQVNIVQAEYEGKKQSLLFTKGDAARVLR
jgi:hypothetical protein